MRLFLRQLWNVYAFLVLYANAGEDRESEQTDLDRWAALAPVAARSRRCASASTPTTRPSAGRAIDAFVEDLSNWYVRRSRRRFWDGERAAFETLRFALVTVAQLLAPFTPFIADEIYDNLDGELPSVHLCDFPRWASATRSSSSRWRPRARRCALGLAARRQVELKVRQPLREAVIVADGRERAAIERLATSCATS